MFVFRNRKQCLVFPPQSKVHTIYTYCILWTSFETKTKRKKNFDQDLCLINAKCLHCFYVICITAIGTAQAKVVCRGNDLFCFMESYYSYWFIIVTNSLKNLGGFSKITHILKILKYHSWAIGQEVSWGLLWLSV